MNSPGSENSPEETDDVEEDSTESDAKDSTESDAEDSTESDAEDSDVKDSDADESDADESDADDSDAEESDAEEPDAEESDADEPDAEESVAERERTSRTAPNWPVIALVIAGLLVIAAVVFGVLSDESDTSSAPADTSGNGAVTAPAEFCEAVQDFNDANAALASDPELAGQGDAILEALQAPLARIAATAPPAISEAAATLEVEFLRRLEILAAVDFNAENLTPEQLEELNDPSFQQVGSVVAEFTLEACGVPLGGAAPQAPPPQAPQAPAPQAPGQ